MSVLICKNIRAEGPGTIEDYLRLKNIPYKILELSTGEALTNPDNFSTLIMMGGPMSVNESEIHPYIKEEEKLVRDFTLKGKRILGICLGAQIMAKALGANVYAGRQKEIGWYDIELTGEGLKDFYMRSLALHPKVGDIWKRFKVFHWHGETFNMPDGAVRLAGSELYPNQAFKYRDKAYAFQFHIEVTKEMIYDWLKSEPVDFSKLKDETERCYNIYHCRAINFYEMFFKK